MNYGNRRKMWKNIPLKRRYEMKEYIENMNEGLDKDVLTLLFIEDMNPREAAEYAKEHNICIGKQFKPLSARRIQQISKIHFPDIYEYTPKTAHMRQAHREFTKEIRQQCAICGSTENIEMHHMIPLFLGGTTDRENCIGLCRQCHQAVTIYHKMLFPEQHKTGKRKELPDGSEQLMF